MILFQAAVRWPRGGPDAQGQMVDDGFTGSRLGVLETPSAIHRAFQKDTLTGDREKKMCFLIYRDNTTGMYFE